MLNQDIFSDSERIKKLLREPVAVIENALEPQVAQDLYDKLLESNVWQKQGSDQYDNTGYHDDFKFRRQHIDLQNPDAPVELVELYRFLNSEYTRKMFTDMCGSRCDNFRGTATIFNRGDHISEHNDLYVYEEKDKNAPRFKRVLTFNYYLSKGWKTEWGGNLVWKKPHKVISPEFNRLVLFNVTENSHHWVEPVLIDPEFKRLSITGWYLQEIKRDSFKLSI